MAAQLARSQSRAAGCSTRRALEASLVARVSQGLRADPGISRDAARELGYVQAMVFAALMLNDAALLNQLTGEIVAISSERLPFQQVCGPLG